MAETKAAEHADTIERPREAQIENPLGNAPIGKLIMKFAAPAIVAHLVGAVYNITDQIFIGQLVGMLGNAATNVAFPLTTLVTGTSVLLGVGGAANMSLNLGAGKKDLAIKYVGNSLSLVAISGILIAVAAGVFLQPILIFFGATEQVLPYAYTYTGITTLGIPFILLSNACSNLIRADGSPLYSMIASSIGAVINVGLDALFMFGFGWGIAGAAWATVIGQVFSALMTILYLRKFKLFKITLKDLRPSLKYAVDILKLGFPGFLNLLVSMVVQVVMNNTFRHYGAQSMYGSDIPLAVVGVIMKVNILISSFTVGLGTGCQPIFGFNYGAKQYLRVRKSYITAFWTIVTVTTSAFVLFQTIPRQIVGVFGGGSEVYFDFAVRYMRIFLMMMFISGVQPMTAYFFSAIGKPRHGAFLSFSRQGLFLLPLVIILPMFLGLDGAIYAGPIADTAAVTVSILFSTRELRRLKAMDAEVQLTNQKIQPAHVEEP